ncbi:MAG: hypothetical protein E7B18_13800 [Clostridium sp.]|nr:hypothetical protein [Clostridium sp.]
MRKLVLRNGKIYVERGRFAQALYAEDGKTGWFREWTGRCRDH